MERKEDGQLPCAGLPGCPPLKTEAAVKRRPPRLASPPLQLGDGAVRFHVRLGALRPADIALHVAA